jgi:GTP-binding protein HflX
MRGPGETEIETDRHQVISKWEPVRNHRGAMVRVALVGYTNVGKSTLMKP